MHRVLIVVTLLSIADPALAQQAGSTLNSVRSGGECPFDDCHASTSKGTFNITENAKRAVAVAVDAATVQGGAERRRSMGRTWGGVGLMAAGLFVPLGCLSASGVDEWGSWSCEMTARGVVVSAGMIGSGLLLATVWSDVPAAPSIDFGPGRVRVGKTFSW